MSRYIITERLDANKPSNADPKAQAFGRHSGIYDIRDSHSHNVICASTYNLKVARSAQAKWNTDASLTTTLH